jgi:integrase
VFCEEHLDSLTGPEFSEHVFPNLDNTRHPLQGGRRSWVSALTKGGIPYFPWYNLRHTFASRLAPLIVAQMLGHSSAGIVTTYAKAIDEARREAICKLEEFRESARHPATTTSARNLHIV